MRKIFIFILILTVFLTPNYVFGQTAEAPEVYAQGAVLMDGKTGRVLWEKNMGEELPMASTTKIMTCILALESGKLEEIVETSGTAAAAPKVKMGLARGEKHRLYDLLYPLMLQSSNDAAVAIAEHIGGSVEGFAHMMNEKAIQIGALNTEFVTPNGLDSGNHHSTAYDMALITRYALKNEEFLKIINTPSITIPLKNMDEKSYTVYNKNRLLNEYSGAIGVKTGFTGRAGNCFVGAAQRNGMTLISVVLASGWGSLGKERKWSDTKKILDYGFDNFSLVKIMDGGADTGNAPVAVSKDGFVSTETENEGWACMSAEEAENLRMDIEFKNYIEAPVLKGEIVGKASVYTENGEKLFETNILADSNVERHDFNSCLKKVINLWLNMDFKFILCI